ncbi:MAG: fused MFS/spermidine synthase [Acidobacteriota bacterium]
MALIVFFLSGFAALLYQVVWQRLLVVFSGADVYSVTIIVTAFMTGLGAGSLVGGRLADRIGPRASLWGFAVAELSVGGFGLASKTLYYDVLYVQFPHLAATPTLAAVVLIISLLWPTFFMGVSLPLLARALTDTPAAAGPVIGSLYGWNTLGAATGAFVATWVLVPSVGLTGGLWIAGGVSLLCAGAAALIGRQRTKADGLADQVLDHAAPDDHRPTGSDESEPHIGRPLPFGGWVLVYGLTGFIALGLEIAWFRLLGVILKSTAFTFGTLLGIYLAGLGLGAAVGARRVARSRRPGMTFLALQCASAGYTALSLAAVVGLVSAGHPVKLVRYLGSYEPVDVPATLAVWSAVTPLDPGQLTPLVDFAILYLVVPAVLIGPPTLLMGVSFPYLQQASHSNLFGLGRRLGLLLCANIAGGAIGAIVTGWVLLPWWGTAATFKLLVGLGFLLAVPLARGIETRRPRVVRMAAVAAASSAVLVVFAMPDGATLWARLHATTPREMIFAEDGAGLSVLKGETADLSGAVAVFVNGLGQSWIPFGGIHTALGALPALIHANPAEVLLIGLGSGDTAFAVTGRPEVRRITSVEIIGAQRDTLRRLAVRHPYPGLVALLADPRVEHLVGDGRAFIRQAGRLFDIIEADALRPGSAYSGNLYSREYFELVLAHLAPGGLAVTWAPTERIQRTFASVFPHVLGIADIYIGSNAPIPFNQADVRARAASVSAYFQAAGVDIQALVDRYLEIEPRRIGPEDQRSAGTLNSDLFPRDEFALARPADGSW